MTGTGSVLAMVGPGEPFHDDVCPVARSATSSGERHSFVLRVWLDETDGEARPQCWRGLITHVPDQQRQYIKGPSDITDFVARYLQVPGERLHPLQRFRQWLSTMSGHRSRPRSGRA